VVKCWPWMETLLRSNFLSIQKRVWQVDVGSLTSSSKSSKIIMMIESLDLFLLKRLGSPLETSLTTFIQKYFKHKLMFGLPRLTIKGNSISRFNFFHSKWIPTKWILTSWCWLLTIIIKTLRQAWWHKT